MDHEQRLMQLITHSSTDPYDVPCIRSSDSCNHQGHYCCGSCCCGVSVRHDGLRFYGLGLRTLQPAPSPRPLHLVLQYQCEATWSADLASGGTLCMSLLVECLVAKMQPVPVALPHDLLHLVEGILRSRIASDMPWV